MLRFSFLIIFNQLFRLQKIRFCDEYQELSANISMDERRSNTRLRDKISYLEEQSRKLARIKDELEEQVTERTRHLREQKEQMQAITENVPGVVFQFYAKNSGETGVHYVSPKMFDIFGLKHIEDPELYMQTFSSNIHEEDQQVWFDSIREVIEKQIPWRWRGRYVKPSGEIIWFEGHSIPTLRKDEIVFDGIFIDITRKIKREEERREVIRQQEQLKKLDSLKTMAGAIAHRFNNAMMAVQGNLELMELTLPDDSDEYKMVVNAAQAASGASRIGSMMLTYVGQKPLQLQELSLSDLVRESVTGLKGQFSTATTLKFTPPVHSLYCSGDEAQIKEVIESVLTNAIESLDDEGGVVEVTFGVEHYTTDSFSLPFQDEELKEGMYVYFQIQDNGHGISAGNLSQIFEPFYTTKFVGRGLGLALTVGILQAHHGAIIVDSTLGKGTTVRVLFPLVSPVTRQITPVEEGNSTVESKPSMTGNVLFADDEPIILLAGQMMLEQFGFTVYTAANGMEAVELVRSGTKFRAIVLDILMPEMDGIEAMQEIRKINPAIPILLVSGYSEDDLPLEDDQENKPDAFIAKPVRLADLREKLEMLLG